MTVESFSDGCLHGYVQQGCIGVGEQVYINGDYSRAYQLYRFDHHIDTTHAKAGQKVSLCLEPNRKSELRQAHTVTSDRTPVNNAYRFHGSVEEYFEDLLRREFAKYTLKKQMTWPGLDMPINFMLLQNGRPVAAIFVFDSHDAHCRYQAQKAGDIFAAAMIGCTHFYADYRNDELYVTERIRSELGC